MLLGEGAHVQGAEPVRSESFEFKVAGLEGQTRLRVCSYCGADLDEKRIEKSEAPTDGGERDCDGPIGLAHVRSNVVHARGDKKKQYADHESNTHAYGGEPYRESDNAANDDDETDEKAGLIWHGKPPSLVPELYNII